MASPIYADQSANALRFHLLRGVVDLEQFMILEQAELKWKDCSVRAGIIGASHFLTIDTPDGNRLNEVFACTEIDTDLPFVQSGPLGVIQSEVKSNVADVLRHVFTPRIRPWEAAERELRNLTEQVERAKDRQRTISLSFEFPRADGDTRSTTTLVLVHAGDSLEVRTAHCYPNEDTVVFTRSNVSYHD